jgi:hypothetical protein
MVEQQRAINLPWWWSGDVELTGKRLREEIKKRNFPSNQEDLIFEAMDIANQYHAHQERANGEKYVIHAYRVALSLFLEFEESSFELVTAALFHDLLEDTTYPRRQMKEKFGETVERLVDVISREEDEKRPKQGDKITDKYFRKILESGVDSIKLKVADKLDNIRDALNHPNPEKRRLYIRECQTVFLPLLEYLENSIFGEKIRQLFEEALLNHPSYIEQILLFNPDLDYWITSDDVQRVKISLHPGFSAVDLVKSAAVSIINRIKNNRLDSLLYIANLPAFLDSPGKIDSWNRVKTQLTLLVELLSADTPPQWLKPIMETPGYLLAVIHSRLFMPANWLFPLWQKDYGDHILETNRELYLSLYQSETGKTEKWLIWLHLLLVHREALWRLIIGNGCCTAHIITSGIKEAVRSFGQEEEYPLLVSMRLLAEYLDVITDTGVPRQHVEEYFAKLWDRLNKPDVLSPKELDKNVEIIGFEKVRAVCPGLETQLSTLRSILEEYIHQEIVNGQAKEKPSLVWINFNVSEIQKRLKFFQEALKKIDSSKTFKDLNEIGIHVQIDRLENVLVFTVEPDKWDALKNRIPEITDKERKEIQTHDYSAAAIFDTLLKNKLEKPGQEPLWIPRVYRILDTMADFDPANVQPISISFQAEEQINDVKVYLPIPREAGDLTCQEKRKEITARYIVTTIYNHVVTLGIYSAVVDCSPLEEQKQHLGFNNHELENMLGKLAVKLNYESQYSRYVEKFNFKKFSIKSALQAKRTVNFTNEDINYGSFLGIDIGGTDTKVSLFYKGDIAFKEPPLLIFGSFAPGAAGMPIPAREFCRRIIDNVDTYLNEQGMNKFSWESLQGVGISWPGGVRNSKIVTYSRVLEKILFDVGEKAINIKPDSSPLEIHSVDLAGVFREELGKKFKKISPSFVVAIENDGNSEAYGNYCHLTKTGDQIPGGKLIIKLGTSTAGGYVHSSSALSPLVTEFAKIILDFNIKNEFSPEIQGPVREFVSSKAVRNLSRTFQFNRELVIGNMVCQCCNVAMNESDSQKTRIEAIEIGKLLNFFAQVQDPQLKKDFLKELVESDNQYAEASYVKLIEILVKSLRDNPEMKGLLIQYIRDRGEEEFNRVYKDDSKIGKSDALIWNLGISRLRLLFQLNSLMGSYNPGQIPDDFDFKAFAKKILGAVALFSQVGMHISHLVAALYNIFKKERFNGVILSGGVLRNETGKIIVEQTEGFLAKYYDKIFGAQKHLKPGSVQLAVTVENPDTVGPFGAAMVANRIHKMNSLAVMEKEIDYRVRNLKPGDTISIKDLEDTFKHSRIKKEDIREYLELLISKSILLQQDAKKEVYVKALTSE